LLRVGPTPLKIQSIYHSATLFFSCMDRSKIIIIILIFTNLIFISILGWFKLSLYSDIFSDFKDSYHNHVQVDDRDDHCPPVYIPDVPNMYPHNQSDNFYVNHTYVGFIDITVRITDGSGYICWSIEDWPDGISFRLYALSNNSYVSKYIMVKSGCIEFNNAMFKLHISIVYGIQIEKADFYGFF